MVTQNDLQVNPEKLVSRLTMNLTGTINTCHPILDTDNLGQYQYCYISPKQHRTGLWSVDCLPRRDGEQQSAVKM